MGARRLHQADVAEAAGEECERVFDDGVEVGGAGLRGGELGERGELVDQDLIVSTEDEMTSLERADDGEGVGFDLCDASVTPRRSIWRRICSADERDGRERILDFVSDAAGDFFPGGLFLRAEKFGGVFENQDVAEMRALGAAAGLEQRDGGQQSTWCRRRGTAAAVRRHLHLGRGGAHAVAAAEQVVDRLHASAGKIFSRRCR